MQHVTEIPFNIKLLIPTDNDVKFIRPVKVLDIMEGKTRNFHPDGLFSTETFGKVGDERRNRQFSYINLKTEVFHPIVFTTLGKLKHLYTSIMSGTAYAVWDTEKKDFDKASGLDGDTGFSFFLEHFKELTFEERPSTKREAAIKLINQYRDNCLISKLVVLPAGLRDFEYDDSGKPSEDEVNNLYRSCLGISNIIVEELLVNSPKQLDTAHYRLQLAVNNVYDYFNSIMDGKKKLILGKWASRKVFNSTRNVITSLNNETDDLDSPNLVSFNQTTIGLYQFMKAALPLTIYHVKNGYLSQVFQGPNEPAILVNKKTLKKELIHLDPAYFDKWMTNEGLEQIITQFSINDMRFLPIETKEHYLGLIYKGPDGSVKIFQDINDLPEDREVKDVTPLTFCELLYMSVYSYANNLPLFFTRYPVVNYGSIYPSKTFLKTTVKSEIRTLLDDDWHLTENKLNQFPIINSPFVDSMSPHTSKLIRLVADFDGDTASGTVVYTDDAIHEVDNLLNSRAFYVGPNGKINFSASNDNINYILASITG